MKKIFLISLILSVFLLCSCSETAETQTEAPKEVPESPVSDVTDSTGLKGTWATTITKNDTASEVILALNSNDTYEIWYKTDNDGEFDYLDVKGSFTDDGKTINFKPDDPESVKNEMIGSGSFTYKLEEETLTLTNSKGEFEIFVRET